jgi:hypothetical protein
VRRSRWLITAAILVGVAIVAAVAAWQGGDVLALDRYRSDDERLTVTVTAGPSAWTRVMRVTESADRVAVEVKSLGFPGPTAAVAKEFTFTVTLDSPLGSREVVDGLGNPAHEAD